MLESEDPNGAIHVVQPFLRGSADAVASLVVGHAELARDL